MASQQNIICSTDLTLGLGFASSSSYNNHLPYISKPKTPPAATKKLWSSVVFEPPPPSLNLSLSCETSDHNKVLNDQLSSAAGLCRQDSSASSYQSNATAAKREREGAAAERVASRMLIISDEEYDNDGCNVRKKHRLSKSQSSLLEESFRQHATLNPVQKQQLARALNLRPRQVEVWFQNRRARTKLKQIEADYELLKKCCQTLTDENRRLKKEVQELRSLNLMKPSLYMQTAAAAATLTKCPSCSGGGACKATTKSSFTMAPTPHFYNPVTSPSAA